MYNDINPELKNYIENTIMPMYDKLDKAHGRDHIEKVIEDSAKVAKLTRLIGLNKEIIYTSAALHDIGLTMGDRKVHHINSAKFVMSDKFINEYFEKDEVEIIALACKEHRASNTNGTSNIYSSIISDADRVGGLNITNLITRTYDYNRDKISDDEKLFEECYTHLVVKFGMGGYMKFNTKASEKAFGKELEECRRYLKNKELFREKYNEIVAEKEAGNLNESAKSKKQIYHLSPEDLDGVTSKPRIPDNYLTREGYEENKTPRISFADTIDGCLRGMSSNLKGMVFYVHVPDGDYKSKNITNKEVPDQSLTGEVWVTSEVKFKKVGKILIINDKGENGLKYKYGDTEAELYDWNWKWLDNLKDSGSLEESAIRDKLEPLFLVLTTTGTTLSNLVKNVTKAKYTHASISFDLTMNNAYSFGRTDEGRTGFGLETRNIAFGRFSEVPCKIMAVFVPSNIKRKAMFMIDEMMSRRNKLQFNILGIFGIYFNKSINRENKMFCSQFVDSFFKGIGFDLTKKDSGLVHPMDFDKVKKGDIVFDIYEGDMVSYNIRKAETNLNKVISKLNAKNITESFNAWSYIHQGPSIVNEINIFPVKFREDGALLIKKIKSSSMEREYQKAHRLLISYEESENWEGVKYELAKLWACNMELEKRIFKDKIKEDKKNTHMNTRARVLNDFNKYLKIVQDNEEDFNFTEYYQDSPFNKDHFTIKPNTIKGFRKFLGALILGS